MKREKIERKVSACSLGNPYWLSLSLSLTVSEKTFRGGLRAIRQRGNPSLAGTGRSPPIVGTLVDARARTLFRFMEVNVDGCLWTS